MFPVIHHSISEARAQIRTGHHDIRAYFSDTTAAEPTTSETQATTEEPTTSTVSIFSRRRALRNEFQQARTQLNTISTNTR
jgi:hypothetical protein